MWLRTCSTRHSCTRRRTTVPRPWRGCSTAAPSVRLLIAAGADVDRRNDYNGDNALGWAEYVLARERPGDAGVTAVRDLLRGLGSRPAVWSG